MDKRALPILLLAALGSDLAGAAGGAQFPTRPIRMITGDVGGAPDVVARLLTPGLTELFREQVVVDNRGGGNGLIAAQLVARSAADGYNILLYASALWLSPILNGTKEEPLKELAPISFVASAPNVLVVHPSVPVKSTKDLISLAKTKPGQLNYGSGGVGSSPYLAAELFKVMADVNIVRIGYKGGGPAVNDLLAGQIQMMFSSASAASPHVASGKLRALAVTSPQPSPLTPGLPTVASTLPGFETQGVYALFAPLGTPPSIINLLQQNMRQVVNRAEVRQRLSAVGAEPIGSTAEELAATLKTDMARWAKIFRSGAKE